MPTDTTLKKVLSGSASNSIDQLLERDEQRVADGFKKKIRIGKFVKPGKGSKNVVVVPTTTEEKLYHDEVSESDESESGGNGEGKEGDILGESPLDQDQDGSGNGAGQGSGGSHEIESSAYAMGKILTEKFNLPNLKDKGKKKSLTKYTYDLSDRNRRFGQVLEKKATLRQILKTNIALGRVDDVSNIDTQKLIVSPADKVYRILSREKDYESQAMVFFLRDYSASMDGKCSDLVISQHLLIYSWLTYQYEKRIETRFILHDTEAKEVPDLHTYYSSSVAGGTQVSSAYNLVNSIVETEQLAKDYNIYVFHGSDGDDWDTDGKSTLPEVEKMLSYVSRMGITVVKHSYYAQFPTNVETYIKDSEFLTKFPKLIRMDAMPDSATEERVIDGIKKLVAEERTY